MEAALCLHCRQPVGDFNDPRFCCSGCRAVHRILMSGPFSKYYEMKEEGVCFSESRPVRLEGRDYAFWNESSENPLRIYVEGVHCTACVWLLEKLSEALPADVSSSTLNLSQSILRVGLHQGADRSRVARMIESLGYRPHLTGSEAEGTSHLERENRKRLVDIGVAGALAGNVMLMSIPLYSGVSGGFRTLFEWLSFGLAIPTVFYSGRSFFGNVLAGLRNGFFPIDAPILLAILTAFFYSVFSLFSGTHDLYFDSLTALIFLLLSSRYHLARMRQATGLSPALIGWFHAPFSGSVGDSVLLHAGEAIAFDGRLLTGKIWVDQSHFTGESEPVLVNPGDAIHAGTRVVDADAQARARVEAVGAGTRLQKFLSRLEEARGQRTRTERATERWAGVLLKTVLLIALIAGTAFWSAGMGSEGFKRVLALLIVTCPCALALATPLVYGRAASILLSKGLLLKNPEALDEALGVKTIAFDKTGTLTFGTLKGSASELLALDESARAILASLTSGSGHPVSRALYRETVALFGTLPGIALENHVEVPGVGVEGWVQGVKYGLRKHPSDARYGAQFYREENGHAIAIAEFGFQDCLRPDSASVATALKSDGYELRVLTGDHEERARRVLGDLPVTIHASLSPADKAERAREAMMVGDGGE